MMLTGDADSEAVAKKAFPCRKKCLRTISDELTLSEAVDLTAPNLEVRFDPSLPWPDRAHIDPEEKTCPKKKAMLCQSGALKCALIR